MTTLCPCGSVNSFTQCCRPYLSRQQLPDHPEKLMRSRYCAYFKQDYEYIIATYSPEKRDQLSVIEIKNSSENTSWLKLDVLASSADESSGEVEFAAYYKAENKFYCMHELSQFIKRDEQWYYLDGEMLEKSGLLKPSRNANCICGSSLKFKRCCGK